MSILFKELDKGRTYFIHWPLLFSHCNKEEEKKEKERDLKMSKKIYFLNRTNHFDDREINVTCTSIIRSRSLCSFYIEKG